MGSEDTVRSMRSSSHHCSSRAAMRRPSRITAIIDALRRLVTRGDRFVKRRCLATVAA